MDAGFCRALGETGAGRLTRKPPPQSWWFLVFAQGLGHTQDRTYIGDHAL